MYVVCVCKQIHTVETFQHSIKRLLQRCVEIPSMSSENVKSCDKSYQMLFSLMLVLEPTQILRQTPRNCQHKTYLSPTVCVSPTVVVFSTKANFAASNWAFPLMRQKAQQDCCKERKEGYFVSSIGVHNHGLTPSKTHLQAWKNQIPASNNALLMLSQLAKWQLQGAWGLCSAELRLLHE